MHTLYLITALLRTEHLAQIGKTIEPLQDYFNVQWLCVWQQTTGCEKRNAALATIYTSDRPGWLYHLDDDNIIHPTMPKALHDAITQHPQCKVFLFPQRKRNGGWHVRAPAIVPCRVDTGSYVAHSTAAQGIYWEQYISTKHRKIPDYWWIKRVVDKGHTPTLITTGCTYYNGAG